ncbi:MAG TPA: TonB-dependent receptor [Polyangia bacterium]|jgi:iron complex outermembrane receptor protein
MPFLKATAPCAGRGADASTFRSPRARSRTTSRGRAALYLAICLWPCAARAISAPDAGSKGAPPGDDRHDEEASVDAAVDADVSQSDASGDADVTPGLPPVAPGQPPVAPPPPAPVAVAQAVGASAATTRGESVVRTSRTSLGAAREDVAATSSVLFPAESPRARDDLGSLLLEVPGANVTRQGGLGALTTVSLRGSNPDEVRIYIDGIPLNQAVGGAVDLSTLPLGDVERVEVYRGSTPIAFGESALGGVISIATKTPGGPTWVAARAGMGSFQTLTGDAQAGGSAGPLRIYVGLHALRSEGDFPDAPPAVAQGYQPSTRENADLSQLDGVARAALSLPGRRELRLGVLGLWRDQGLPAPNIYRATTARANAARALAHLDYESRDDLGENSRLRLIAFASGTRDEFSDPNHEIVGVPTATHDLTGAVGVTASAEKSLGAWGRLTTLAEGRAEDYVPHNDFDPVMPVGHAANRLSGSVGAELDVHIAPAHLDVIPSARLEASRDVRTGRDLLFGTQLPPSAPIERLLPILRLGVLRPLTDTVTVRANVGRYARLPSFLELYGYNSGVLGNPQLSPEHGVNADVGVAVARRGQTTEWTAAVTAFGARADDLIEWRPTATQTRAENIASARIWGVETESRLRGRHLSLAAQATLTDARDESDILASRGQQLVFHPRYRGYARVEWRQPIPRTALTVAAYADVDGTAGNNRAPRLGAIPPRAFLGAGLSLSHAPTGLRLVVSGANLADARTQDFQNYPIPGRSLFMTLGWSSVVTQAVLD